MPATMRDVALRAGVSVKTVSNYFADYAFMRPETRARVAAAVDELDYRVNLSARRLRTRRTGVIALIVPELTQAYFAELAQEVIAVAATHHLTVLVETTGGSRERELAALSGAHRQLVDGVVFDPLALGPQDAPAPSADAPLVVIGERQFEGLADHVLIADAEIARAAAEHLLAVGRRRILVLGVPAAAVPAEDCADGGAAAGSARGARGAGGGPAAGGPAAGGHTAALRLRGVADALAAAGLALDPELLAPAPGWSREAGARALRGALDRGVAFDAVLGLNDALALGALRALAEGGVAVPAVVAVMGIDDTADGRFSTPTLSTMSPGRAQIARTAVELLVARIADPGDRVFTSVVADFELVVRESTGPAAPPTRPGDAAPLPRVPAGPAPSPTGPASTG